MPFTLHPRLEQDCFFIANLPLCRVLLMNNRLFPWLILVPTQDNATELFDLSASDQVTLLSEIERATVALKTLGPVDKFNVAALGNQVPQLHIHVIARRTSDAAWPNPVWGGASEPYGEEEKVTLVNHLSSHFQHRRATVTD